MSIINQIKPKTQCRFFSFLIGCVLNANILLRVNECSLLQLLWFFFQSINLFNVNKNFNHSPKFIRNKTNENKNSSVILNFQILSWEKILFSQKNASLKRIGNSKEFKNPSVVKFCKISNKAFSSPSWHFLNLWTTKNTFLIPLENNKFINFCTSHFIFLGKNS